VNIINAIVTCQLFVKRSTTYFGNFSVFKQHKYGRRKDFFQEGPKVVKFAFNQSKLKKQRFLLKINKYGGAKLPSSPHTDAIERKTIFTKA